MKVAIYTRKSKLTDQGDSINMQIDYCKRYISLNHPDEVLHITTYSDEGFSGGNIDRPDFKKMMTAVKANALDIIICYRLDRISRNIADFSITYQTLEKHHVQFISVKEQFDTSTPIGRAMLNIALVFSQMERETIAERIRDNLKSLAEKGQWLGGTTPLGYVSQKVDYTTDKGRTKHYFELALKEDEAETVKLIYNQYHKLGSITQVEYYLIAHNIKTRNNKYFSPNVIRNILINPSYCAATLEVYHYFMNLGCNVTFKPEQCNPEFALIAFNRLGANKVLRQPEAWIIALGSHKPIIEAYEWLKTQQLIQTNHTYNFGKCRSDKTSKVGMLSKLLYCGKCGAPMRITNQEILADGSKSYIYRCSNKLRSKGSLCDIVNAKGHYLDPLIWEKLQELAPTKEELIERLIQKSHQFEKPSLSKSHLNNVNDLQSQYDANTSKIANLLEVLAITSHTATRHKLLEKIEVLEKNNNQLQLTITKQEAPLDKEEGIHNIDRIYKTITKTSALSELSTLAERRFLLQQLITRIDWYEAHVDVFFNISSRNLHTGSKITP
ncbi:recombinase family protein [Cellulosilyticum ruminicola]|uniref:recombinase family protein n=1 Tax=Cellulosilyticum ruminicola TaxID=425254 RepID=UPI0006D15D0D|nr:recombinase family protein [Cellulosilyticum ruminicola]